MSSRSILSSLLLLLSLVTFSQEVTSIYITYDKFVYIIFPDVVKKFDLGSGSIYAESEENIVKLIPRSENIPEASLFVTTASGYYYFLVSLNANGIDKYVYNVNSEYRSADVINKSESPKSSGSSGASDNGIMVNSSLFELSSDQENAIRKNMSMVYLSESKQYVAGKIHGSLALGTYVGSVSYDGEFIYMTVILENNAAIDFNLDFVKFFVETKGSAKRKTEFEEELLNVAYWINTKTIGKDEEVKYVFVFEKFTMSKDKQLRIEFWEAKGDRKSILYLDSREVLNATKI